MITNVPQKRTSRSTVTVALIQCQSLPLFFSMQTTGLNNAPSLSPRKVVSATTKMLTKRKENDDVVNNPYSWWFTLPMTIVPRSHQHEKH